MADARLDEAPARGTLMLLVDTNVLIDVRYHSYFPTVELIVPGK